MRASCKLSLSSMTRARADSLSGAIGAWIKNVEQLEETDGPNGVHAEGAPDVQEGIKQSI
jgi:hypothetical protein